jgi:hypothetical protein
MGLNLGPLFLAARWPCPESCRRPRSRGPQTAPAHIVAYANGGLCASTSRSGRVTAGTVVPTLRLGDPMNHAGSRVTAIVFIAMGLLAFAVAPFLLIPAVVAGSWIVAARLRTTHPRFSRAWSLAGVSAGLLAAAVGASIFTAPQFVVSVLLLLAFIAHAVTVILFGQAWSQGNDHPAAAWVTAVSLGLVGVLGVVLMGAFGRRIALADAGQSSWVVEALILLSGVGIPAFLLTGLIAFLRTRQAQRPIHVAR